MTPLHPLGHNSNSSLGTWQRLFPASWSPRIKAAIWEPRKHEHSQTANPHLLFTREQWIQPKFWLPKSFQTLLKCQPSPFKNHSFLKQSSCLWRVGKKWLLVREFFRQIKSLQKLTVWVPHLKVRQNEMQPRKKLRLVCLHWECFYKLWLRSFERINAAGFLFITAVIDQLLFYFKEPEDGGGGTVRCCLPEMAWLSQSWPHSCGHLHKTLDTQVSAGIDALEAPPHTEPLLAAGSCWEREPFFAFFQECGSW